MVCTLRRLIEMVKLLIEWNNMRYIRGKYTGGREGGLELQNDDQIWCIDDSTGRFYTGVSRFSLEMNFSNVVDGILFAEPIVEWNNVFGIYFMVPETHFLFNQPMIASNMYYMISESQRESLQRFATLTVIDIIKTKLVIKI